MRKTLPPPEYVKYDTELERFVLHTALGPWLVSEHALTRIRERFPYPLEDAQRTLRQKFSVRKVFSEVRKDRTYVLLQHALVYHQGEFYVAILNIENSWAHLTTWLSEDIYIKQLYAVRIQDAKEEMLESLAKHLVETRKDIGDKSPLLNSRVTRVREEVVVKIIKDLPSGWRDMPPSDLLALTAPSTWHTLHYHLTRLPSAFAKDLEGVTKVFNAYQKELSERLTPSHV